MSTERAVAVIEGRAARALATSRTRWRTAGMAGGGVDDWVEPFARCGRLTVNFHPDRVARDGRTVAAGLASDGVYRSQWMTGISAGSRSAVPGGERERFEREYFEGALDGVDPASGLHPVYGAFDLLGDDHGGSPRFGSSYLVLADHVRTRTTLCLGDSHGRPVDVGTFDRPYGILAGLAEQATAGDLLGRGLGPDVLVDALLGRFRLGRATRDLDHYVEAQVHGSISLRDDVLAVVLDPSFRGSPVDEHLALAADRFSFEVRWHCGSELAVDDVPSDFRGPTMPDLARRVAGERDRLDARAIGVAAARLPFEDQDPAGDAPDSPLQQLKYLWHTLLAFGHDAGT